MRDQFPAAAFLVVHFLIPMATQKKKHSDKFIDAHEIAELLGCSPGTVHQNMAKRFDTYRIFGNLHRWNRNDFEHYLNNCKKAPHEDN